MMSGYYLAQLSGLSIYLSSQGSSVHQPVFWFSLLTDVYPRREMTAYRSLSPSLNWRSATCFRQILLILLILLDTAGYWSGRAAMAGRRSDALGTSGSPPALTTPCIRNPDCNTASVSTRIRTF